AQGIDVMSLGAGEPDFDTPAHIKEAAHKAIRDGFTKYTAVGGIPSLKKAIIDKMKRDNALDYKPNQVLVSNGGKQSCYNLCQALYDRTIVIHAVSKTYSMTGWRIGWACGPAKLITAMNDIQSQSTSNPNSIAQVAAEAALNGDQACVAEMCKAFKARHDKL